MAYGFCGRICVAIIAVILLCINWHHTDGEGQYSWMKYDHFDDIDDHIRSVNAENCHTKKREDLFLRKDTVAQLPVYNQLLSRIWYKNRTSLIHIHNMALNRAFFYSYVLQKMNSTDNFNQQPNWMYFYFSAVADINANPSMLNGSAIYFDNHCHYPNWYTTVPFNTTLPLFGPKAFRWDDYQDSDNYLREPSRQVVQVMDIGINSNSNYTHSRYKMNPWYTMWMPDLAGDMDSLTKFTYYIGMKYSNQTGYFLTDSYMAYSFFGPANPGALEKDKRKLPVVFTQPYFDCGGSNKWIVSAVAPVVDFMPRYAHINFTHLARQRIVAAVAMDTDFIKLDFNACGVSPGNPGPSYLSGIARCKKTTGCKHKMGYGFKRGGYVCVCKPGRKYPWWLDPPFQGESVEQATKKEHSTGFVCPRTDFRKVLPIVDGRPGVVEGGQLSSSSGGLPVDGPPTLRRRRSTGIDAWFEQEKYWTMSGHSHVNSSDEDIMDSDFAHSVEEKYSRMNNVHVDIERMYTEDVLNHKQLRRQLLDEHPTSNFSGTIETLAKSIVEVRDRHIERFLQHRNRPERAGRTKRGAIFDGHAFDRMMRILRRKRSVNYKNCHTLPTHHLRLPGDVGYGAKKQFQSEGRTALRLTHFLSMYLQNVQRGENFGYLRGGGPLHIDQMFGEVIANVMGNFKIYSAGLYFDRYKFENLNGSKRELFGPWAYRKNGAFYALDTAGMRESYLETSWFKAAKARFSTNFHELKLYKIRPYIRTGPNGTSSKKHEYFPVTYRAANYNSGIWTAPFFRCDGNVNAWVMTYVSPFFGLNRMRTKLEFRGVATVDVPLNLLEIYQCPQSYRIANAFKNTARCDYFSTKCKPQAGFPFMRGSYSCQCRMGFEYWHLDGKFWIEGSLMESEFEKKRAGYFSRFDSLNCRISAATRNFTQLKLTPTMIILLITYVVYIY